MRKRLRFHHLLRSFLGAVGCATAALPLTILFIEPGLAQQLQYGTGFSPYVVASPTAIASPELGMNCPLPSFNISGFAGDNDQWATLDRVGSGATGNNNYGIAAGVTLPFTGSLGKFCKEFAAERLKRFKSEAASNDIYIIEKCISLRLSNFSLADESFKKYFPVLAERCAGAVTAFQSVIEKPGTPGNLQSPPPGVGAGKGQGAVLVGPRAN
jgi:hypothetical protein